MVSTDVNNRNPYEAARNHRVEENKRRFEDLGISKLVLDITKSTKKPKRNYTKMITRDQVDPSKLRRSSRLSKNVSMGIPPPTKSYRPREKLCSSEEQVYALKVADDFQSKLQSNCPSLSTFLSYTDNRSWLILPVKFCKDHISSDDLKMVLEDDKGLEHDSDLIVGNQRAYLCGGWRDFVLAHRLEYGDALVFELIESVRFKVYIFKARQMT